MGYYKDTPIRCNDALVSVRPHGGCVMKAGKEATVSRADETIQGLAHLTFHDPVITDSRHSTLFAKP